MKVTRANVFETNSSSSHSLVIGRKQMVEKDFPEELVIYPGEFGWGPDYVTGPEDKTRYLVTGIQYLRPYISDYEVYKALKVGETTQWELISEIWKEYTNTTLIYKESSEDEFWEKGYIDHQSVDICLDMWKCSEDRNKVKEKLKDFIFNNQYEINISNDNI